MTPDEFESSLLIDPAFRALLARFAREPITWDGFLNEPLPRNMSAARTWDLMNDLSRDIGLGLPIPDLDDNEFWYRRTYLLSDVAAQVASACKRDSRLYRTMTAAAGHHFVLKSRISETIAAAKLDGLHISEVDADAMLRLDRAPQSPADRLLANTYSAFDELERLVDEPFSAELLGHLNELLIQDVDVTRIETSPRGMGLVSYDYADERVAQGAQRQMRYIVDYANHDTGDEYDLPVLRGLLIGDMFRFYRPIGFLSSQVGRLVSRLYELKHDLPVIGMLPISRTKLDWENGIIAPPLVLCDWDEFRTLLQRCPGDLTIYQTLSAQLALLTLLDTERYVETWERQDREMREILRQEPLLNQRQRSILARALRVPDAEFTIRYHRRNHNLAYTTARRDLLELRDKGYLAMEQRGKAFVFTAAEGLGERLGAGRG